MHTFSDSTGLNYRLTSVQQDSTGIAFLVRTRADPLGGFVTTVKRRALSGYADIDLARGSTFEHALKNHDRFLIDIRRGDEND